MACDERERESVCVCDLSSVFVIYFLVSVA